MVEEKVSLNEIRKRYEKEDLELSTEMTMTVTIAICHGNDDEGNFTGNQVMVTFMDEEEEDVDGTPCAFLEPLGRNKDWTLDLMAKAFKISLDEKVWDVQEME
jgi:hypothetical protein